MTPVFTGVGCVAAIPVVFAIAAVRGGRSSHGHPPGSPHVQPLPNQSQVPITTHAHSQPASLSYCTLDDTDLPDNSCATASQPISGPTDSHLCTVWLPHLGSSHASFHEQLHGCGHCGHSGWRMVYPAVGWIYCSDLHVFGCAWKDFSVEIFAPYP